MKWKVQLDSMQTIIIPANQTVSYHEFFDTQYSVKRWYLEPYSTLILIQEQELPCDVKSEFSFHFQLKEGSSLQYWPLLRGASSFNLSLTVVLDSYAQAFIHGAYALNKNQQYTIKTHQEHRGIGAKSNLVINGIVADTSMLHYSGMITVYETAAKTNANQENKTILCGSGARAISIPSLEIKTNDVLCGHGSAIGPLIQEHIYYAQSRGISYDSAKKLLLQSFFNQTLVTLPKEFILQDTVVKFISKVME